MGKKRKTGTFSWVLSELLVLHHRFGIVVKLGFRLPRKKEKEKI